MPFWMGQETLTTLQWAARAATAFFWLLLMTKLMGQREIGQMTLFDFAAAVTIGSITGGALSSSTSSLVGSMIALTTFAAIDIAISIGVLKMPKLRRVLQEEPLVLVQNGQLLEDTMRRTRFNLDNLMSQLRQKNYPNLADIEFAILEPSGKISVIPKSQARPVTPKDLGIGTTYEGMPTVLIEDGKIAHDNLRENGLDSSWLNAQLALYGTKDPSEVMAAVLDTQGKLYVSKKNQTNEELWH